MCVLLVSCPGLKVPPTERTADCLLLLFLLCREVGGRRYYGVSKEKAAARKEYEGRKVNSENVGLVESRLVVVCGRGEVSGGLWWRGGQW